MIAPDELRRIRLSNDYRQMLNIRGPIVDWTVSKGQEPEVERYKLTVNVRTIIGSGPEYRDKHTIAVKLPADYPNSAPVVEMISKPPPFHPNWYRNGEWCDGHWDEGEGLGYHIIRMIRTLQFDREITNPNSAANSDAKLWYLERIDSALFPCDKQQLPDPTGHQVRFDPKSVSRFIIKGRPTGK